MPGQNQDPSLHNHIAQIWAELRRLRINAGSTGVGQLLGWASITPTLPDILSDGNAVFAAALPVITETAGDPDIEIVSPGGVATIRYSASGKPSIYVATTSLFLVVSDNVAADIFSVQILVSPTGSTHMMMLSPLGVATGSASELNVQTGISETGGTTDIAPQWWAYSPNSLGRHLQAYSLTLSVLRFAF